MPQHLTDLPNIGNAIAADLRSIGISSPDDIKRSTAMTIFNDLRKVMAHRHDPCVYYTLLSVEHYFATGQRKPWWAFSAQGKADLLLHANTPPPAAE